MSFFSGILGNNGESISESIEDDSILARSSILALKLPNNMTYVFGDYRRETVIDNIDRIISETARFNFESSEYKAIFRIDRTTDRDYSNDVSTMKSELNSLRRFDIEQIKNYKKEIENTSGETSEELIAIKREIHAKFLLMQDYMKFYKFDSLLVDHTINVMTIRAISLVKDLQKRQESLVDKGDYPKVLESLRSMDSESSDFNLINELEGLLESLNQNMKSVSEVEISQNSDSRAELPQSPTATGSQNTATPYAQNPYPYSGGSTADVATAIVEMKNAFTNAKNIFKARREFLNNFIERLVVVLQNGFAEVKRLYYEAYKGQLTEEMQAILKEIAAEFQKHTYKPPKRTQEELDRSIRNSIQSLKEAEAGVGQKLGKKGLEKMAKMYVELQQIYQEITKEIGPVTR